MSLYSDASFLLIPSGYEEDFVYAQKPSNGNGDLTWTRASDAFRTNANGQIQRVPWNLVTNSVLAGAVVGNPGTLPTGYVYGITSGLSARIESIGVENGLNYIDIRYTGTATSTVHTLDIPGTLPMVVGQDVTNSIYVKNVSNAPNISVRVIEINSSGGYVTEGGNSVTLTSNLTRYSYTKTVSGSTTTQVRMSFYAFFSSGQTYDFTIRIAAPQMEAGSTASDFFPTTNRLDVPRLSYMYGSCPALLLEPQRTNLLLRSEEFDNASWSKSGVTLTANAIIAPDGSLTADRVQNGSIYQNVTLTNGTIYTASIWIRGTSNGTSIIGTSSGAVFQSVNITTSWQRYSFTRTYLGSGDGLCVFVGSGSVKDIYIWGAQLEVGSYATTYIPTTTATATRLADTFTRNNIYTNGLIGASGGTWFVELKNNVAYVRDTNQRVFGIGDSNTSINNGFVIRPNSAIAERYTIEKYISGIRTGLATTALGNAKIAIKWNGSTADVFQNGVKIVSATTFGVVNMEFINGTGVDSPKFIQQMALFNSPKSDEFCEALTSDNFDTYALMATALGYNVL